eukprot:760819-Hanusia_phi.AAC.1
MYRSVSSRKRILAPDGLSRPKKNFVEDQKSYEVVNSFHAPSISLQCDQENIKNGAVRDKLLWRRMDVKTRVAAYDGPDDELSDCDDLRRCSFTKIEPRQTNDEVNKWKLEAEKTIIIAEELRTMIIEREKEIDALRSRQDLDPPDVSHLRRELKQCRREIENLGRKVMTEKERAACAEERLEECEYLRAMQAQEMEKLQEEVSSMDERLRREFVQEHEAMQADIVRMGSEKLELEERIERANMMIEVRKSNSPRTCVIENDGRNAHEEEREQLKLALLEAGEGLKEIKDQVERELESQRACAELEAKLEEESRQKVVYLEHYQRESEKLKVREVECERLRAEISTLSYELEMKLKENESLQRDVTMVRHERKEVQLFNKELQAQLDHREQECIRMLQQLNSLQPKQDCLCEIRECETQTEMCEVHCLEASIQTSCCGFQCENCSQTEDNHNCERGVQTDKTEWSEKDLQTDDLCIIESNLKDLCKDHNPIPHGENETPEPIGGNDVRDCLHAKIAQQADEIEGLKLQVETLRSDLNSKHREVVDPNMLHFSPNMLRPFDPHH